MTPHELRAEQIKRYCSMSGEQRLDIGLRLHEMACEMARESIRHQFPDANASQIAEKLKKRLQLAYRTPTPKVVEP